MTYFGLTMGEPRIRNLELELTELALFVSEILKEKYF